MRLSLKVPLLTAAGVVATATLVGAIAYRVAGASLREQAIEGARDSVDAYADGVQGYLAHAVALLVVTARDLPPVDRIARTDPVGRGRARSIPALSEVFEHLMLLDRVGRVTWIEPAANQASLVGADLSYFAWYRAVATTDVPVVSGLHISPSTNRPTVVIALPLEEARGRRTGVYVGALRLSRLAGLFSASDGGRHGSAFLTDAKGLIVAHQGQPSYVTYQTDFSRLPPVRAALRGRRGAGRWVSNIEGDTKLGAWVPLQHGWTAVYRTSERVALAPTGRLARTIAGWVARVALLFALVAFLFTSNLLRPIRALTRASEALSVGDLSCRADVKGAGEIRRLADRFNDMAVALQDQTAVLAAHSSMLQAANAELESFSYSVAHDLRAPLRAIAGFSHALADDLAEGAVEQTQSDLAKIQAATGRMGTLIDDLLHLSQLSRTEPHPEAVDLSEIARAIFAELAQRDADRRVSVTVAPGARAMVDRRLVTIVLTNLLENAWKFTRGTADARIGFGFSDGGAGRSFFVRDNGAGFDMAYASKLFSPFQRLHSAREFEGAGIGLATAARIVQRHGGTLAAEGAVDRGATFTFTLPMTTEGAASADVEDNVTVGTRERTRGRGRHERIEDGAVRVVDRGQPRR